MVEPVPGFVDIIQGIARQRGRGETGPLITLRQLDGTQGERISHLPVEGELGQAWVAFTGEPFRPHQAQVLTALRRGESVALAAANPANALTAYLMSYAALQGEPSGAVLFLAPGVAEAQVAHAQLDEIGNGLPAHLRRAVTLVEQKHRPDLAAHLVVTTPETFHTRLLRHHDRAWSHLWARLRLVVLLDSHRYQGIAGVHIAELLLRMQRVALAHSGRSPALLATLYDIEEPQPALTALLGSPPRVILGDDVPQETTALAIWQAFANRLRESAELAVALNKQGYHVHIACRLLEVPALTPMIADVAGISCGPTVPPAHVCIAAGFPGSRAALWRMLRSGHEGVVLVLGDLPYERMLARRTESLLTNITSRWPPPQTNAYVTAQHVLCAASELPLTAAEIDAWGAQEIVKRLANLRQLVDLPDPEVAWKPTLDAGDPYEELSLLASSGNPIIARSERGQPIDHLDPTGFERWTFQGAALPPGAGGMRVTARDEEHGSLTLRPESNVRRTYPLRRCKISIRDERGARPLFTTQRIAWGRVMVEEETYAFREASATGAPTEIALQPPLSARWVAPACWFDLPTSVQVLGQLIGWSLATTLPLATLADFTDVVPCYDQETKRLFLVDAQPGGSGLVAWMYQRAEDLLPLAYDIAYACRTDPLLEPLARVDMDWLLPLLGTRAPVQPVAPQAPPDAEAPAAPSLPELIVGTPPIPSVFTLLPEARRASTSPDDGPGPSTEEPATPPPGQKGKPKPSPSPAQSSPAQKGGSPPGSRQATNQPPPASPSTPSDAAALIDRLRRQRQQREAAQTRNQRGPTPAQARMPLNIEPRFRAGERIFCLPYGDGVVQESWFEGDREMLAVSFPDHGELTIDPSVSLVRKLEDKSGEDDDLL